MAGKRTYTGITSLNQVCMTDNQIFKMTQMAYWNIELKPHCSFAGPPSAVGSESDCKTRARWFNSRSGHILSLSFGHEKNVYDHSHPSVDSRMQLSVTGEIVCTKYW